MSQKERREPKRYSIDWVDSCSNSGWQADSEVDNKPARCQTVGFFVREDKEAITIALSRSRFEGTVPWAHTVTIPKSAITRKRQIK